MKFELGWHFPDHEQHLQHWMKTMRQKTYGDRYAYQLSKYNACKRWVKKFDVAIDVGAHIGLWSWPMTNDFEKVVAFEPVPDHANCYRKNIRGALEEGKAELYQVALGEVAKPIVHIFNRTENSSGDSGIDPQGRGVEAEMKTLDQFNFEEVDFLKIDCEGYEVFIVKGAVETLKRCKPCVIVEQKPETGMEERYNIKTTEAVEFLKSLGAVERTVLQGDYILSWE